MLYSNREMKHVLAKVDNSHFAGSKKLHLELLTFVRPVSKRSTLELHYLLSKNDWKIN